MKPETANEFRLMVGDWGLCQPQATRIRHEVFVDEQKVPLELELDEHDPVSLHVVAYDGHTPAATGRLLPDGHIGRMAVRLPWRGKGLGSLVLTRLVDEARQRGHLQVVLAAQLHACGFYGKHGFLQEGDVFLDAGIEHVTMRRVLVA